MKRSFIVNIFSVTYRRNKSYKFLVIKYEGAYLYALKQFYYRGAFT